MIAIEVFALFTFTESLSRGRLLVAITKSDRSHRFAVGDNTEVASIDVVRRKVCKSMEEAAKNQFLGNDEVIPVSGLWGVYANRLRSGKVDVNAIEIAEKLSQWQQQMQPCGQGENNVTSISLEEKVEILKENSGIPILEQR